MFIPMLMYYSLRLTHIKSLWNPNLFRLHIVLEKPGYIFRNVAFSLLSNDTHISRVDRPSALVQDSKTVFNIRICAVTDDMKY